MLYWGMISFITPPVAIGAFAAASVAGANGMKTGFQAMKLGSIIYFVPFFFVLNPALIGNGTFYEIVTVFTSAVLGIIFLASSLQGYLIGLGSISNLNNYEWPARAMLGISGILMALPGGDLIGYSNLEINLTSMVIVFPVILFMIYKKKYSSRNPHLKA